MIITLSLAPSSINGRKEQVIKYDIQFHGDGDDDADVGTCDNMWDPVVGVVSTSRVCVTHSTLQHLTCQRVPKVDINRKLFCWAFELETLILQNCKFCIVPTGLWILNPWIVGIQYKYINK